jgi:hypothetical protein
MGAGLSAYEMETRRSVLMANISIREDTFFSQERFIQAVVRSDMSNVRVLKLQSANSPAHLFSLEHIHRYNRRSISIAPFGLPGHPIDADGSDRCVSLLVAQLQTSRTISFEWNVRHDHRNLANQLERCGLRRLEESTHVLNLDSQYDAIFREFSESTRNQIRQAARKGLVVKPATTSADVAAYYVLYRKMIGERQTWSMIYKQSLFNEMFKLQDDVIFLRANVDGLMIGGGWFIRDGSTLLYWQSALNYEYRRYFPHYALIDYAIQLACNESANSFNMGASSGKTSLEQFKSFWGAQKLPYWRFVWQNPFWSSISGVRRRIEWLTKKRDFIQPG